MTLRDYILTNKINVKDFKLTGSKNRCYKGTNHLYQYIEFRKGDIKYIFLTRNVAVNLNNIRLMDLELKQFDSSLFYLNTTEEFSQGHFRTQEQLYDLYKYPIRDTEKQEGLIETRFENLLIHYRKVWYWDPDLLVGQEWADMSIYSINDQAESDVFNKICPLTEDSFIINKDEKNFVVQIEHKINGENRKIEIKEVLSHGCNRITLPIKGYVFLFYENGLCLMDLWDNYSQKYYKIGIVEPHKKEINNHLPQDTQLTLWDIFVSNNIFIYFPDMFYHEPDEDERDSQDFYLGPEEAYQDWF